MHCRCLSLSLSALGLLLVLAGCQKKESTESAALADTLAAAEQANLANFDDLDFRVFTGQRWDELSKSHAANIVVHWPDGHTTTGIEKHVEDLKWLFTYAPDTRIQEHPVKIADGEWTAVTGWFEGTFTQPMILPDGTVIQPTGKAFRLPMCTVGHWSNGVMDEEYLYWDNQTFMNQIGLGQPSAEDAGGAK